MFLFLIAAGLSLIFGVLRVLNFAHGSFYMVGAYLAWQVVQWLGREPGSFWPAFVSGTSAGRASSATCRCSPPISCSAWR